MRLYSELQAAKVTIEKQEERIEQLRREREEFAALMKRSAVSNSHPGILFSFFSKLLKPLNVSESGRR